MATVDVDLITVRQFEEFIDAGILPEDARIELIGGRIVPRMPANQPHNIAVLNLADGLRRVVPPGYYVAEEKPTRWGDFDRPMPDIAVVRGRPSDYPRRPPRPRDIALVIEVSDTSGPEDRQKRWARHAAARFPSYWIVDVRLLQIEVSRDPRIRRGEASYATAEGPYADEQRVPVVLDGLACGHILVREVFVGIRPRGRRGHR